jgi:hypothetical protein
VKIEDFDSVFRCCSKSVLPLTHNGGYASQGHMSRIYAGLGKRIYNAYTLTTRMTGSKGRKVVHNTIVIYFLERKLLVLKRCHSCHDVGYHRRIIKRSHFHEAKLILQTFIICCLTLGQTTSAAFSPIQQSKCPNPLKTSRSYWPSSYLFLRLVYDMSVASGLNTAFSLPEKKKIGMCFR